MFAFKGQVASLMEEESALLSVVIFQPDVEAAPAYNRLFWNYTRGIDSGEVTYALNYNIKERDGSDLDGNVDAADASKMYLRVTVMHMVIIFQQLRDITDY